MTELLTSNASIQVHTVITRLVYITSVLQGPGKADTDEKIYEQTEKIVADLKNKWEKTEEKPAAIGLTVAAFVGLYVLNGIVGAIDNIPIVSGVLELVGIFVTSWFVYRYLVFGPGAQN